MKDKQDKIEQLIESIYGYLESINGSANDPRDDKTAIATWSRIALEQARDLERLIVPQ